MCQGGLRPIAVLTQPDRPAGRGRQLAPSPVKVQALALGLPVLQPATLKSAEAQADLAALAPDLMVVVAYGLLLPPPVLALPGRGCVNIHASLLPRWRGAAPIQAAIRAGDAVTGISIMALDAGLDTGPVYGRVPLPILAEETAGELEARLAQLGAETLLHHLPAILDGTARPQPQSPDGATYAGRISKADARIDWQQPAVAIARQVRAQNPWPVAETRLDGAQLRCYRARALAPEAVTGSGVPGQIIAAGADGLDVGTGDGVLRLLTVQAPGRQAVPAADFARGRQLPGRLLGP